MRFGCFSSGSRGAGAAPRQGVILGEIESSVLVEQKLEQTRSVYAAYNTERQVVEALQSRLRFANGLQAWPQKGTNFR